MGVVYTDEQCQAQYGTTEVLVSDADYLDGGAIDVGACSLTAQGGTGFCSSYSSSGTEAPEGSCYYTNDFNATSTGNTNTPGSNTATPDPDLPDYLTETDDPDSCPAGHVAYGGQSYCVDQSAIDDGSVTLPDPGDDSGTDGGSIDWGEESAGTPAPGTSTGSDGNPLGMGGGDPDGDGEGDSTAGDIVGAINSLKSTVRNGFDGLVDKLTEHQDDTLEQFADAAPSQADYDAQFGSQAQHTDEALGQLDAVKGELTGLIDGSDSEFQGWYDTLGGYFGSYFPSMPAPSCSPLVFAQGAPYSFTIDCTVFEKIRAALAWILGVFTVWVVLSTLFTARPH